MFWPDRRGKLHEYMYAVILETPLEKKAGGYFGKRTLTPVNTHFHVGQIVVVETFEGGLPMEVGSQAKPGRLNCRYELFGTVDRAIDKSCELWGIVGYGKRTDNGGKKWQKKKHRKKK